MAVQEDSTKRGLTGSFHQRTYGTVKDDFSHSPNPKNSKVLIHEVKPTDTLQGIALKYDVSIDQIRTLNKLGYSESVQTRSVLDIPCPTGTSPPGAPSGSRVAGKDDSLAEQKDYLEKSPQSILSSADEELEHAKEFVAKLAKKHSTSTSTSTSTGYQPVPSSVLPTSARPAEGYNRPPPPSEAAPGPKHKMMVTSIASQHTERDKLESAMFEL